MLTSEPVRNAIPAGFQKIAAELSAKPEPDSPIPPALESGASRRNGTAASPCAEILLLNPTIVRPISSSIVNRFIYLPPNKVYMFFIEILILSNNRHFSKDIFTK
jgi:hypothetical protein